MERNLVTANKVIPPCIRWARLAAKIISVPVILFTLFMFVAHLVGTDEHAVADYPPIENLLPVLVTLSVLCLGAAWRWEILGGLLSLVLYFMNWLLYWIINGYMFPLWAMPPFIPLILCGVLFLLAGLKTRQMNLA